MTERPLNLVGPWYRNALPRAMRGVAPVLQKYETPDLVNEFLKDPQHSLVWTDDDFVHLTVPVAPDPIPILDQPPNPVEVTLADQSVGVTDIRKLFLDVHKRHYLVVCEAHCDAPGFPNASRNELCQMGFVIRRRRILYPEATRDTAASLLKDVAVAAMKLQKLDSTISIPSTLLPQPLPPVGTQTTLPSPAGLQVIDAADSSVSLRDVVGLKLELKLDQSTLLKRQQLAQDLADAQQALLDWAKTNHVQEVVEGWVESPKGVRNLGGWIALSQHDIGAPPNVGDEKPQAIIEKVHALTAMVPRPGVEKLAGKGHTLLFGVVPTAGADHDAEGNPRFDDQSLYEIRCFARRPDPLKPQCCTGPIYWSERTEQYQLAPFGDLTGNSNRPVTVQMPDLNDLAAQAAGAPLGSFRVSRPQSLPPSGNEQPPKQGSSGGFQICFIHLPLLWIVAIFLFELFLPIIVFIFGLWWMLALKLCIPPSLDVAGGLNAALAIKPPSLSAKLDFALGVQTEAFFQDIQNLIKALFGDEAGQSLLDQGITVRQALALLASVANVVTQAETARENLDSPNTDPTQIDVGQFAPNLQFYPDVMEAA